MLLFEGKTPHKKGKMMMIYEKKSMLQLCAGIINNIFFMYVKNKIKTSQNIKVTR